MTKTPASLRSDSPVALLHHRGRFAAESLADLSGICRQLYAYLSAGVYRWCWSTAGRVHLQTGTLPIQQLRWMDRTMACRSLSEIHRNSAKNRWRKSRGPRGPRAFRWRSAIELCTGLFSTTVLL